MKLKIILLSTLVFVLMSFSSVWAYDGSVGTSESQLSSSNMASITPLMKGSSSSSGSKSSSSSKTKTHDGDDVSSDNNSTSDDSSSFPWWIIAIIVLIILGVVGFLVWYFVIR